MPNTANEVTEDSADFTCAPPVYMQKQFSAYAHNRGAAEVAGAKRAYARAHADL